jgi:hypothetical protein
MKTEEISHILGIPPTTFFGWNRPGNKKEKLAQLLKALPREEVTALLEKAASEKKHKPMMLLSTVNCSIGDKSEHFTLTSLKKLFYKKGELNAYEKYALKTIKREALKSEIDEFASYYRIPDARVKSVLDL